MSLWSFLIWPLVIAGVYAYLWVGGIFVSLAFEWLRGKKTWWMWWRDQVVESPTKTGGFLDCLLLFTLVPAVGLAIWAAWLPLLLLVMALTYLLASSFSLVLTVGDWFKSQFRKQEARLR